MTDLISRNEAIKAFRAWWDDPEDARSTKQVIESLPTIDPVKHGKWELVGSVSMCDPFGELAWGKMFRCSECGFVRRFIIDSEHYKFCPNCGAQMESE